MTLTYFDNVVPSARPKKFSTCNHFQISRFPIIFHELNLTTWLDFIPRSRRPAVLCQFSYWPVFLAWSQSTAPQQEHRNIEIQWDTTCAYMHTCECNNIGQYKIMFKCHLLSHASSDPELWDPVGFHIYITRLRVCSGDALTCFFNMEFF